MENSSLPDIGLRYVESLESDSFAEFGRELAADGLDVRVESTPDPGPYAGIEWLLPTAIFVFLGKSYFDGFLKEAGKDHYHSLKKALQKVSSKFFGKDAPKARIVFSPGKAESETPKYSIIYSVIAQLGDNLRVKLLIQSDFDSSLSYEAQEAFLAFLSSVYDGTFNVDSVKGISDAKPISNMLLLAYDPSDKKLVVVDPLAGRRPPGA
jgi:hypothetical protein